MNIECLRDSTVVAAIQNSKNKFDMIAVDEVHRSKDPNSQQGKGLQKIAKSAKYKYCSTGTVLINSPFDAYAPLKFIGYEKANFSTFKQYYGRFESQFGHMQLVGYQNIDTLKQELAECSLRRTKDILDLPPKVIVPEYLEMDSAQQRFYNDLQAGIVEEADRVNIKNTSLLGLVTRLRQAATCPSVLSTTVTQNVKLDRCCELVEDIINSGEKVIVFSTFKEPLYNLLDLLKKYKPIICTGDQTDEEVSSNIDKFQGDSECRIILCTSQRMGTGITLTAASYEIFLDSNWTAALEDQAESRAHRIGAKKSVTIYKLIAKGTIDERIQDILKAKAGMSDLIVDDNYNQTEELKKLLGLQQKQW